MSTPVPTPTPQTIYHMNTCNSDAVDDLGEMDAFFDINFKLVNSWSTNDASWRREYMSPLFAALGVTVRELPEDQYEQAVQQLKAAWGY